MRVLLAFALVGVLAPLGPSTRAATAPAGKTAARPKARIVWTQADLDRVRREPAARITVVENASSAPSAGASRASDEPVVDRYREMVTDAEAKLAALQRERLAASNPFLRGLSRNAKGEALAPRSLEVIDAEIKRWHERHDAATTLLAQALAREAEQAPGSQAPPAP